MIGNFPSFHQEVGSLVKDKDYSLQMILDSKGVNIGKKMPIRD